MTNNWNAAIKVRHCAICEKRIPFLSGGSKYCGNKCRKEAVKIQRANKKNEK